MDKSRFETLRSALVAAGPRRGVMSLLGRLTLGGALSVVLAPDETQTKTADASKKRKKGKKKRTKPLVPPPSSLPPPPTPPAGPGFCTYDGTSPGLQASQRFAQTFLPPRSGLLTGAEIGLRANPANFSLTVQIRSVDALGVPGNSILGTEQVTGITQTFFATGVIKSVPVTFDPAVPLVLGTPYALVVTGPPATAYAIHANNSGNPCSDGKMFIDSFADGQFNKTGTGNDDMVYTLTMTT